MGFDFPPHPELGCLESVAHRQQSPLFEGKAFSIKDCLYFIMETTLNFEKVCQLFQETNRQFKETDRRFKETHLEFKEMQQSWDHSFQEMRREFQVSQWALDRKFQETDRRFKETDKKMKAMQELFEGQWGRLVESLWKGIWSTCWTSGESN